MRHSDPADQSRAESTEWTAPPGADSAPADCASDGAPTEDSAGNLVAQAEALYETYLSGRLQHAIHELNAARLNLHRDPLSPLAQRAVRDAARAVERMRAQLAVQADRVERARQAPSPPADTLAPARPPALYAAPVAAPQISTEPTAGFRAAQAGRAEKIAPAANDGPPPFITREEIAALRRPGAPAHRRR